MPILEWGHMGDHQQGVKSTNRRTRGLVLFSRRDFSTTTYISWDEECLAYTSFDPMEAGQPIRPGFSERISLGQTLIVSTGGIGTLASTGPGDAFRFHNQGPGTLTCGLALRREDPAPYCAFPVLPGFAETVRPTDRALLVFSSETLQPGTLVSSLSGLISRNLSARRRRGTSPGILVDLASAAERTLTFDLSAGWGPENATWVRSVSATKDLSSLLVEQ